MDGFNEAKQTIDLGNITEGKTEVKKENIGTRKLLEGFKFLKIKIHLLSDSLDKIYTKQKYQEYFDAGILGLGAADRMTDEGHNNIWKKGAKVHIESADNLVIMKKEQRAEFRTEVQKRTAKAGWKECKAP